MHRQEGSNWASLPQELVHLIIGELIAGAGNDFSAAKSLLLACKDWEAALRQYPAALYCRRFHDLQGLCNSFPRLVALQIPGLICSRRSLGALSACKQLTCLSFERPHDFDPVDLCQIPSGLRKLLLASSIPTINSLGQLSNVTHLSCCSVEGRQQALPSLFGGLPSLRVSKTMLLLLHLCCDWSVLIAQAITKCL